VSLGSGDLVLGGSGLRTAMLAAMREPQHSKGKGEFSRMMVGIGPGVAVAVAVGLLGLSISATWLG